MGMLRVVFPKPGFFLADVRLVLTLDGWAVYDGSFKSGFDLLWPVADGPHRVGTVIDIGITKRQRFYDVMIAPNAQVTLELAYSRFWGNFKKSPKLTSP